MQSLKVLHLKGFKQDYDATAHISYVKGCFGSDYLSLRVYSEEVKRASYAGTHGPAIALDCCLIFGLKLRLPLLLLVGNI